MIESFNIDNFKGLKELCMDGITPITLVTGHNNVGKTSLLEALFLFYHHTAPDVFAKLSNMRSGFIEPLIHLWEPLFFQMNVDQGMSFVLQSDDETEKKLFFKKDTSFMPSVQTPPSPDIMARLLTSVKASYTLEFRYNDKDYTEHGHFSAAQDGIFVNVDTSLANNERKPMPWTLFINSSTGKVTQDLVEWIGNLEIQEKKEIALDILKMVSTDIRDIFNASQNGAVQLYIKGKNGVIPLKYAGDGMIRLLYMMAAIVSNPDSLILIDEIENGLHYSMYAKLWEMLAKLASENRCQIIATSHSYENIAASVKGIKKAGFIGDFSLHRMEKAEGEVKDYCFESDLLEAAIKADMEVR